MSQNIAGFANEMDCMDDFCMEECRQANDIFDDQDLFEKARQIQVDFKQVEKTGEYCETHYYG